MEQNKSFTNSDTLVFSSADTLKQQSPPATQRIKVESVHVVLEGESQTLRNGEGPGVTLSLEAMIIFREGR